jgi:hypothetical protein
MRWRRPQCPRGSVFIGAFLPALSRQNWPERKTNIDIVEFLCENAWLNAITRESTPGVQY